MNSVAFIVTMLPIGVMLAATAVVILKTRVLPAWLGLLAAITAPACLINGMFLDAEFGPAFLLFLLWVTIASIVMTLRAGRIGARPLRVRSRARRDILPARSGPLPHDDTQNYNLNQSSLIADDTVVTKVLVRDASIPAPTGVSIP